MRHRHMGVWSLGIALILLGAALWYESYAGVDLDVERFWPVGLVLLGLEMIISQAVRGAAGEEVRLHFSGLAVFGFILIFAVLAFSRTGFSVGCLPWIDIGARIGEHETREETFTYPLETGSLDGLELTTVYGEIRLWVGPPGTEGKLEVSVTGYGPTAAAADEAARAAGVDQDRSGTTLVVRAKGENRDSGRTSRAMVSLTVTVPPGLRARLESEFGNVSVRGPAGEVAVDADHGDVAVEDVAGAVKVESTYGEVSARHVGGALEVRATHGGVVADDVGGNLVVETTYGHIEVRRPHGAVRASSTYAAVFVRYEDSPKGDCALESTYGGVSVELPLTSPVDLDAAATRTRISTNLPAPVRVEEAGSGSNAKGQLNGGGVTMRLRDNYGRIEIRGF